MNYPLISEYIEAIKSSEDNFEELTNLRPILSDDGQLVMTGGNFAVVFKMEDVETGKLYALKCFTKEQEGREEAYKQIAEELEGVDSPYIVPIKYLEKELFVDSSQTEETEFPVLLMDWVEGITLDKYLRENLDDQYALEMLAYRFSQLAQWIIPQPFAHGDLKPDNILVREDGTLVLVDYDGMYVPAMKGQKARELGSPDFRHPLRTENDFDEHIDDFPLISILLSLKAISLNPRFLEEYGAADRLLFSEKDYRDISKCELLKKLYLFTDTNLVRLISLIITIINRMFISTELIGLIEIVRHNNNIEIDTEVADNDFENTNTDKYNAKYTHDYSKLIQGPSDPDYFLNDNIYNSYSIRCGTKIIANGAFSQNDAIEFIEVPSTVTHIGNRAFWQCENLYEIILPNSIMYVGNDAFTGCRSLHQIIIPKGTSNKFAVLLPALCDLLIEDGQSMVATDEEVENGWSDTDNVGIVYSNNRKKLLKITGNFSFVSIRKGTEVISNEVFKNHYEDEVFGGLSLAIGGLSLAKSPFKKVTLPNTVRIIGRCAFWGCNALIDINIPESVKFIGDRAFERCDSLTRIAIPESISYIGESTFEGCNSLISITIPESILYIGKSAFEGCLLLSNATLPNSLTKIPNNMFYGCRSLSQVNLPRAVNRIGDKAFFRCVSITDFYLPESVVEIGEYAFAECISLRKIKLPNSISKIVAGLFDACLLLDNITIPDSIIVIEHHAFCRCESLKEITIPHSVYKIERAAFYRCKSLRKVSIRNPNAQIEDIVFDNCKSLISIIVPNGTKQRFVTMMPKYKKQIIEEQIVLNKVKEGRIKRKLDRILSRFGN